MWVVLATNKYNDFYSSVVFGPFETKEAVTHWVANTRKLNDCYDVQVRYLIDPEPCCSTKE